jgi:hypothetical protein
MPARRRAIDLGAARGRDAVASLARELDDAIRSHGLSHAAVGRDVGLSGSQVGRVARGLAPGLSIVRASELLAAVGLELSVRVYPTGRPLRDTGHLALLERLRCVLHQSLTWRTEVPVAGGGDLRAWDAMIGSVEWRIGVEAETRLHDIQAIERRIALKQRDGSVGVAMLLLANTRHNRTVVRSLGSALTASYPLPSRRALELLAAGVNPAANSIVLL